MTLPTSSSIAALQWAHDMPLTMYVCCSMSATIYPYRVSVKCPQACSPRTSRPRSRSAGAGCHPADVLSALPFQPGEIEEALHVAHLPHDLVAPDDEVVGVEELADVGVGQESRVARISLPLEAVELEAAKRVDAAELVDDEDRPTRANDAGQLGHDQLGSTDVVQHAHAADDVERPVGKRQRGRVRRRGRSSWTARRPCRLDEPLVGIDARRPRRRGARPPARTRPCRSRRRAPARRRRVARATTRPARRAPQHAPAGARRAA